MPSAMLCRSVCAYRSATAFLPPPFRVPRRRLAAGPFIARICVRARARVCAGAVRAPDCPREATARRASPGRRCEMSCSVMFAMPSAMSFAIPFLHIVPPPRLVLLRSVCPAAGWWRDPLPRAFAPVRFARLIAPAREPAAGRTPPLRSRRGFFRGPSRPPAQKAERRPWKPPFVPILPHFSQGQAFSGTKIENTRIFFTVPRCRPHAGRHRRRAPPPISSCPEQVRA